MKAKISILKIAAALVGGIIGAVIGNVVYAELIEQVWKPLVVALFFLILAVCIFLPLFLAAKGLGNFDYFLKSSINKKFFKYMLPLTFVGIFAVSMLFEFLYELGGTLDLSEPTSYIFALDISSSMRTTDPNFQEAEAVTKIIGQMEDQFPFAVYTFSSEAVCTEEMHHKTQDDVNKKRQFNYDGATCMYTVLQNIVDDYNSRKNSADWIGGNAPRIILVSDGEPTDGDWWGRSAHDVAKVCRENGISICGIGVVGANEELLKKLSENTGGQNFSINDIDNLYDTLSSALTAKFSGNRTLLSYRGYVDNDMLYAALRIIFLALIAFAFTFVLYLGNAFYPDWYLILFIKALTALIVGFSVEFSVQSYLGNEALSRGWLCVWIAACILRTAQTFAGGHVSEKTAVLTEQSQTAQNLKAQTNPKKLDQHTEPKNKIQMLDQPNQNNDTDRTKR